jgi:TRAP-type C4-dicarboxylate transport system substrate-binding protein
MLLVTAACIAASACNGEPPARSGQSVEPVALSSVTTGAGNVGGDVLAHLVDRTAGGAVRVDSPSAEPIDNDAEGTIIERLRAGTFDVSVVRADRLATAGATSLSVLQIPLLVTNAEHAATVASNPVADLLMADLNDIGLVGLALVPGGSRHPFGYGAPLYGPADYVSGVFNARVGDGVDAIFGALGATTENSVDESRSRKVASGELRGIELSVQQLSAADVPSVMTSNITLYTKFDVVVIRGAVWNTLTAAQRDELRAAAKAAGAAAIAQRDTELEGLARWCATDGAASVVAGAEQVTAIEAALQPVIKAATSDPGLTALAEQVEALAVGTSAPAGTTCGDSVAADDDSMAEVPTIEALSYEVLPEGPQDVLAGVWRLEVTQQYLVDNGFPPQDASANAGVWTLSIVGNIATVAHGNGPDCTWEFRFAGDAVSIDMGAQGNDACSGRLIGTYRREGDVVTFHFDRDAEWDVALDNAFFAGGMRLIT